MRGVTRKDHEQPLSKYVMQPIFIYSPASKKAGIYTASPPTKLALLAKQSSTTIILTLRSMLYRLLNQPETSGVKDI